MPTSLAPAYLKELDRIKFELRGLSDEARRMDEDASVRNEIEVAFLNVQDAANRVRTLIAGEPSYK